MMGHSESENKEREGRRREETIHMSRRKEVITFALMRTARRGRGKGCVLMTLTTKQVADFVS